MNKLTAVKRSKADKLKTIREGGMVPAVVYGASVENTSISVPSVDFEKILKVAGESSTITLEISGDKTPKKLEVLIHEVQVDPVKGNPIHIDFLSIDVNKPVEVTIPVEFEGVAPAEKNGLGILVKVMHEVEIEALPKNLPHNVVVDLSSLIALNDQIHAKDIKLAKEVTLKTNGDEVIALIAPIKEEVVEEAPVDLSSIEVEKKGKKEEEAGETPTKSE